MVLNPLQELGRMGIFLFRTLMTVFVPPLKLRRVLKRVQFVGYQSLVIIVLTGLFTGMVLGYQGHYTLSRVGTTAFLGPMVALSLLREMGPVLSALMVTARAGSAISAEVGIMRINEEIDALELMGLDPFRYHMVPIFLGTIISMPLLTMIFNAVGIGGGYLVGVRLLGVGSSTYFGEMADYAELFDMLNSLYKSLVFGGIIAWVACYKGYHTGFGAEGVSQATTKAVVLSSVLILMSDYFLTSMLF
ncbi:MAG: MlaE family ABC transporter permease [Planctomycetota bacterium]